MTELWGDIAGFEGFYQVSNQGRIKSLTRRIVRSDGIEIVIKERIRAHTLNANGYPRLNLCREGVNYGLEIHRLVAIAFVSNPNNLRHVNHKDKNPQNNNDWNLEWVTNRENATHKFIGTGKTSKYPGVSYSEGRKKWVAQCQLNGIAHNLGRYISEEQAKVAYCLFLEKNGILNKYAQ